MQSHDLTPLLDNPSETLRETILIEEDQVHDMVHTGRSLRMRTLITDTARLTIYDGLKHGELFNRAEDPAEMHNLFGLPEAVRLQTDLMEKLAHEMMSLGDNSPRPTAFA